MVAMAVIDRSMQFALHLKTWVTGQRLLTTHYALITKVPAPSFDVDSRPILNQRRSRDTNNSYTNTEMLSLYNFALRMVVPRWFFAMLEGAKLFQV